MLPKFMNPFKAEQEEEAQEEKQMKKMKKMKKKQNNSRRSCQTSMDVIGLRLVTHITNSQTKSNNSNVVVKSAIIRIGNNINGTTNTSTSNLEMCFLKNCSLCYKKLKHDQDIYMYRGDQGFCSIECRSRQIVRDEVRELEESTEQRAKSSSHCRRNCWNDARRHETRLILEDLRLHRLQSKPIPSHHPQNHWAIV